MRYRFLYVVCLLGIIWPGMIRAESAGVGRFVLPDVLQWKRLEREVLGGHSVSVATDDDISTILVFGKDSIICEPGTVRRTMEEHLEKHKTTLFSKQEVILNIDGRAWRGIRGYQSGPNITCYFGSTYREGEVFRVFILRKARADIPDDLRAFLRQIKIGGLYAESPANAFLRRGNALVSRKDYRGALREFDRGVQADSTHWPVWYFRGVCQRRMGDHAGAEDSLRKALHNEKRSALYVELGRTLASAGRMRAGLDAFESALRLNPENADAFLRRGNVRMRAKDYDQALQDLKNCLAINPCNRSAAFNSAQILFHIEDDPAAAIRILDRSLEYNPGYKVALQHRRKMVAELGEDPADSSQRGDAPDQPPARAELPEWIQQLPDVPEVQPVAVSPGLDYFSLTQAQYAGAVRAAKEACRRLLGPLSAREEDAFAEKWQPMLDYPAPQCMEYLEKLVPVLEKALGTRAALADNLLLYERLWTEAGYAAHYSEKAGAELMRAVARQAAVVESLRSTVKDLMEAMAALGDPPDAVDLKAQASSRHERAMRALERLLGRSAPLTGAYDRTWQVTYQYYRDDPEQPYWSGIPLQSRGCRYVFLPLSKGSSGAVLFYRSTLREETENGKFLDPGMKPESWLGLYAEPEGAHWVSYEYDEEDDQIWATYYRPNGPGLVIDEYIIQDGELREAERTAFARRPLDRSLPRYPDGLDGKKLNRMLREKRDQVREMEQEFVRGRTKFKKYVDTNGFLPEMPRPGGLHWVLKDVNLTSSFENEVQLLKTEFEEKKVHNLNAQVRRHSLEARWKTIRTEYELKPPKAGNKPPNYIPSPDEEGPTGGGRMVPVRKEEKERSARLAWSLPPLAIPDGGYWPIRVRGSGRWRFSLNHSFDPNGRPSAVNMAALVANRDRLFVFDHTPAPDEEISLLKGVPADGKLMLIDSHKQGGDHVRCLLFRSEALPTRQSEYPISLVVICEGGWLKLECTYELKNLDEHEAERLLRKTAEQNAEVAHMLASLRAAQPKTAVAKATSAEDKKKAEEALSERVEFHRANIAFCERELGRLREDMQRVKSRLASGKARPEDVEQYNALRFRITCQESNIISERDRISELKTGRAQFSRTPFDEMCRMQTVHKVEQEVRRLDAASRARRKAELLAGKLSGGQAEKAWELIDASIAKGGATDPAAWTRLNNALQNIYQGEQLQEIARIEEEIAWRQAQIDVAENVKTGAAAGVTVLSLGGGPLYVNALYQTGTGFAEGGVLEGVKRGLMTWSDAADVAVSGYRGWKKGGWLGMVEGASWSILLNKGPEAALKRINMRGMRQLADAEAAANAAKGADVSTGARPLDLSPTRAAQFKQELEYGESLAEDFFRSHRRLRTAEIKKNVSPEELTNLRMQVRQKAAAVAHSMPAKSYLKYRAAPIKSRAYSETMDDILEDATGAFSWEMRNRGYNRQTLFHCRNASSKGAGMDSDLALKEQPNLIPVRGEGGQVTFKRNNWLTKDGRPVSVYDYQKEGSKVLQEAYKKVTGGYSAKQSFVDMTTSVGDESYPDLTWLKLPKRGAHSDAARVTRKLDEFFGKVDPGKVPDSLQITTTKARKMFSDHPELRPLGSMMESCRGTAKDLETKFIPVVEHNIRKISGVPAGKRTPQQVRRLAELQNTKDHLDECLGTFKDIGQGRIPPYEWERQFRLTTGGRDPVSVIRRLEKITADAAQP